MAFDESITGGTTSKIIEVMVRDSSTGLGKTGLAHGDVTASYCREGGTRTAISLASGTAGDSYSTGKWCEVDATNQRGLYQLHVPDLALAAGVAAVTIGLQATGVIDKEIRIKLETPVNLVQYKGSTPADLEDTNKIPVSVQHMGSDVLGADNIEDDAFASEHFATAALNGAGDWSTHNAAAVVTALGTGSTLTDCLTATGFSTLTTGDIDARLAAFNWSGITISAVSGAVGSVTGTVGGIAGTIQTLDALDTAQDSQHSTTQSAIATAQADLDVITGSDGATLATTQGNYAPAKAGDEMDLVDDPNSTAVSAIQNGLSVLDTSDIDARLAAYNVVATTDLPSNFSSLLINGSGHVSRVTLVDTTTANTDMVSEPLDASGIRTAVGLASANLDTQLSNTLDASNYGLTVLCGTLSTAQASTETFTLTRNGSTYSVAVSGLTDAGVRTGQTLSKS